jgi:hypothetical protein
MGAQSLAELRARDANETGIVVHLISGNDLAAK